MNRTQIGGYVRITKKEAARRYNAGEVIRLTACNREFETVVNAFMYYNCTNETGRYPAYWKKEA